MDEVLATEPKKDDEDMNDAVNNFAAAFLEDKSVALDFGGEQMGADSRRSNAVTEFIPMRESYVPGVGETVDASHRASSMFDKF